MSSAYTNAMSEAGLADCCTIVGTRDTTLRTSTVNGV
jgi:hypothetical protein